MTKLYMLGTGHAITTKIYNTCFLLENSKGLFLCDGGGGNGIFTQMEKVGKSFNDLHYLFCTHAHTDHLLGSLWAIRGMAEQAVPIHRYVYGHDIVVGLLERYVSDMLNKKQRTFTDEYVHFIKVEDGDTASFLGMDIQFFDIHSTKAKQFGFTAKLEDGQKLVCLGDEPFNPLCEKYVQNPDWLLSEAFCLYAEKDIYHPYGFHHSTSLDAGKVASQLNAKNLLLYHTDDHNLDVRRETYTKEAAENFKGNIFVPDDLEIIQL